MPLSEVTLINEYLDYIKFQKRFSRHTLLSYNTDLEAFFEYIKVQFGPVTLTGISPAFVRSWLASLKEKGLSSKTVNRKISTLRSFFKYQLKMGTVKSSPMVSIKALKVSRRLPSFIAGKDLNTLFDHVEFPDSWQGKTDKLLLKIFYFTGIRLSELINLKDGDVDVVNCVLKVLGKGQKHRIVPVKPSLLQEIRAYIADKSSLSQDAIPTLLCNEKGAKLYDKYVYRVVKKYLGKVSPNERKSPHILRHSFATHLTNNGAEINAVKELLGHASLASTQIYTHNSIEQLKEIYRMSHPKSK